MTLPATGGSYYDRSGHGYARRRQPDPRIEAPIRAAIGNAKHVLNVGAGTGSYEPAGLDVVALEPSLVMIGQRRNANACVRGVAGSLPFRKSTFDVAMGVLTIHHWPDWRAGVSEMQRVAHRVVLLTHDTAAAPLFWLLAYFPAILEQDKKRMPPVEGIREMLGGTVEPVLVPHDCIDGFLGAHWRYPERYLDEEVRAGMSGFGLLAPAELDAGLERLRSDLASGDWDRRYGELRGRDTLDIGYRLVVGG